MSITASDFIQLMRLFLSNAETPDEFMTEYLALRHAVLAEQDQSNPHLEAVKATLANDVREGKMTPPEFAQKYRQAIEQQWQGDALRPFTKESELLLDTLMVASDAYDAPTNPIDESEFRKAVKAALDELTALGFQ